MEITIEKEWLETYGDKSLEGLLADNGILEPQPITLLFRQTSPLWREQNGGPDLYLLPEFVPYCLLVSVINLINKGFKISVGIHPE